jgi:lysophospholipase L1-like esterase
MLRLLLLSSLLILVVIPEIVSARPASFADFDRLATTGGIPLTVVFLGGSLTWGANASDPQKTSYRGLMCDYLRQRYPKAPFRFIDASIGGTGSKLGLFRLRRDVLAYDPDLVFLDFAANDGLEGEDPKSLASYEQLLRELIGSGVAVEQVFFGFKYNFGRNYNPSSLSGYSQRLKLVDPYHTGVGDLFPYLQPRLESGTLDIDRLWALNGGKDGTHPDDPGYKVFFEAARDGYEDAIRRKLVCTVPKEPVYSGEYELHTRKILVDGPLPRGWGRTKTYRVAMWFDGLSSRWMGDVAMCDLEDRRIIEPLRIEFTGTFVGVFGEMSENGLDFKAYVDGKPILYQADPKSAPSEVFSFNLRKFLHGNLFGWRQIADNLQPGRHTLEVIPVFPDPPSSSTQGQLRIESVCSAGD